MKAIHDFYKTTNYVILFMLSLLVTPKYLDQSQKINSFLNQRNAPTQNIVIIITIYKILDATQELYGTWVWKARGS